MNTSTAGTVDEGGQLSLTGKLVSTDVDSPNASLVYTLLSLPSDGVLKLNDTELAVGGTFTQKDVIDGNVNYVHSGIPDAGDSFDWELTDGAHMIPQNTFAITVAPTNDAPAIVNNVTSDVAEAGTFVLTPDVLSTSDEENGTLTYTFVSVQRGVMQRRVGAGPFTALAPGDTFTVQDIADGNIRYVDPGTDDAMLKLQQNTTASFSWRVSDDEGAVAPSATGAFATNFTITSVDDAPVFTWKTAQCAPPGNNLFTNPLLSFSDVDNTAADYNVCLVTWDLGYREFGSLPGQTTTQIALVIQNSSTNLTNNSCVAANALSLINVDSAVTAPPSGFRASRGATHWKLMKGTTQFGAIGIMSLPVGPTTPCPPP
ncbi:MAG: cadherin-like domain-containing protein [Kofleriaceae bacterium]